jgi:hypothetical protein
MGNFVILLAFWGGGGWVHCHCFGSLWGKLSQLIVWVIDYHCGGNLRVLNGLYPIIFVQLD